MKKLLLFLFLVITSSCTNDKACQEKQIVSDYIDSICHATRPIRDFKFGDIRVDGEVYRGRRGKIWEFADTLEKYCCTEELKELSLDHPSVGMRYVAFKLLLKKSPHEAVKVLITDIDSKDSIGAIRLDECFTEPLSGLRLELALSRNEFNISFADSLAVDSAVIYSGMIEEIKKHPFDYPRAIKEHFHVAHENSSAYQQCK